MSKSREPADRALYRHHMLAAATRDAMMLAAHLESLANEETDPSRLAETKACASLVRLLQGVLSERAQTARTEMLGRMK